MNTCPTLRLLAVASLLAPGVRLLAEPPSGSESISFRTMTLDLMEKDIREKTEREDHKANRKAAPVQPSPLSAANFDLNKDGKLDDAEFAAWNAAVRKAAGKSPEAMKRFDKNKDGKLDDPEWTAASTELFGQR
jgi:hypothetical protein